MKFGRTPSLKTGHFRRKLAKLGRTPYLKTYDFRRKFVKLERTPYLKIRHFRRKLAKLGRTPYLKTGHFRRKFVKSGCTPYLKMTGCVPSYCTCASREPQWRVPLGRTRRTDPPRYLFAPWDSNLKTKKNASNFCTALISENRATFRLKIGVFPKS